MAPWCSRRSGTPAGVSDYFAVGQNPMSLENALEMLRIRQTLRLFILHYSAVIPKVFRPDDDGGNARQRIFRMLRPEGLPH